MNILNLKNWMRNLALIGAGALMATLIVLPMTTSADDDDDDDFIPTKKNIVTYSIRGNDGSLGIFTVTRVGRDRDLVLTLQENVR